MSLQSPTQFVILDVGCLCRSRTACECVLTWFSSCSCFVCDVSARSCGVAVIATDDVERCCCSFSSSMAHCCCCCCCSRRRPRRLWRWRLFWRCKRSLSGGGGGGFCAHASAAAAAAAAAVVAGRTLSLARLRDAFGASDFNADARSLMHFLRSRSFNSSRAGSCSAASGRAQTFARTWCGPFASTRPPSPRPSLDVAEDEANSSTGLRRLRHSRRWRRCGCIASGAR